MKAMESLAKTLSDIDQNKLWIVAIVVIIAIISYSLKWYFGWKGKQHVESSLTKMSDFVTAMAKMLTDHESSSGQRTAKLITVLEEIRDRQRNVIGKSDSIRIILNKFNDVIKREIINIFEWSIINNDYKGRADFVRKKVKTALADNISIAQKSLNEFNLSLDLDQFFITYVDERTRNIHFKLVDQLWDEVEPIYHKEHYRGSKITEQQLEEMQIAVNNVITAELTKIQMEINNLYR